MEELLEIYIAGENILLGNRYLRLGNTIVLADLHLGKTMHFRKAGLPVPPNARMLDQTGLMNLLQVEQPQRLIVLGDLFHSESNSEVEELMMITSQFPTTDFVLVRGNHDVLSDAEYRSIDFQITERMELGNFMLTHEPLSDVEDGWVNMHGHLHPGILLSGKGRQSVKIPCFHLSTTHFCLPAFGALTGLMRVRPTKHDRIFGIVEGRVVALQ